MLNPRQAQQLSRYIELITNLMEHKTKGNLIINLVGNGELGTQVKIEAYLGMPKSISEDELAIIFNKKEG